MPTLSGLRRRGYSPESIFDFVQKAGVSKVYSLVDYRLLEHCIRTELETKAARRMAVTDPIKLTITNYPAGQVEYFDLPNNPNKAVADSSSGCARAARCGSWALISCAATRWSRAPTAA